MEMDKFRGLSRREFLKLASLTPIGLFSRPLSGLVKQASPANPNVILLVFDAWSQHHVSLYGYRRHTMPNLEKFAETATVYHNHYSTGVFTVPGTSSLLTRDAGRSTDCTTHKRSTRPARRSSTAWCKSWRSARS